MAHARSRGPVYQAGTLSGNPVAVAAGIAALDLARVDRSLPEARDRPPTTLDRRASTTRSRRPASPSTINRAGSLFSVFFTGGARARLRGRARGRSRSLRAILPPHARQRRRAAAVGIRAVDPEHDARPRGDGEDPRGRGVVPGLTRQAGRSRFVPAPDGRSAPETCRGATRPRRASQRPRAGPHARPWSPGRTCRSHGRARRGSERPGSARSRARPSSVNVGGLAVESSHVRVEHREVRTFHAEDRDQIAALDLRA